MPILFFPIFCRIPLRNLGTNAGILRMLALQRHYAGRNAVSVSDLLRKPENTDEVFCAVGGNPIAQNTFSTLPGASVFFKGLKPEIYA